MEKIISINHSPIENLSHSRPSSFSSSSYDYKKKSHHRPSPLLVESGETPRLPQQSDKQQNHNFILLKNLLKIGFVGNFQIDMGLPSTHGAILHSTAQVPPLLELLPLPNFMFVFMIQSLLSS